MSLIRRAMERRDYTGGYFSNPYGLPPGAIPTNGMLGGAAGGLNNMISVDEAMRHWAVWACVRIISDTIASLPIDLLDSDKNPITPIPTRLVQPSIYATRSQWVWQVMASCLTAGNAYGLVSAQDRLSYPTQVDLISPIGVCIEKDRVTGLPILKVGSTVLQPGQFWHLPGPQLPGELQGMSPITYAARAINLGLSAERFGGDYFDNGIHPTATLESDQMINGDQAEDIKARVKRSMQNHDLAVLGAGLKLNPWQISAEDSQFLETQRHNALEIAGIFGVPVEMLGVATPRSSVTYANREQRAQDFLNIAVNPWLGRLEDSLSAWFPRGTYVKFNTGALLRSDLLTRYQAYQIGIQNGFILPSEARELENLEEIPGIDDKPLPTSQGSDVPPSQGSGTNNDSQQPS